MLPKEKAKAFKPGNKLSFVNRLQEVLSAIVQLLTRLLIIFLPKAKMPKRLLLPNSKKSTLIKKSRRCYDQYRLDRWSIRTNSNMK
jgi:hypothetical protein